MKAIITSVYMTSIAVAFLSFFCAAYGLVTCNEALMLESVIYYLVSCCVYLFITETGLLEAV